MRRFLTLYFSPVVVIVLVLIKVPSIEKFIKDTSTHGVWIVAGILVLGTILNHAITVYSPYKKYERWAKNRWYFLEKESKVFVDKYKKQGINIRLNIMIPKFCFFNLIEPFIIGGKEFRKPKLFTKIFEVIWSNGNFGVNQLLKFTVNQGVCGKAFKAADLVKGTHFLSANMPTFNLNKNQMKLTEHLKIVASFRIIEETNTPEKKSNKVIGVLNVESDTEGSEMLITDLDKQKEFYEDIAVFSVICNKLV